MSSSEQKTQLNTLKNIKQRERARQTRGKRHPNIMEDGSLWSDHHPYGQFSSLEEKRKHHREKYYSRVPKVTCDICGYEYFETQKSKHFESARHRKVVDAVRNIIKRPLHEVSSIVII